MTRSQYHHGRLREALVATGVDLARDGRAGRGVLREAARRLEVSPAAGYRHFADREAPLLAVRSEALGALGLRMLEAARTSEPLAHFRGLGEGYVRFALEEPGLFRTTAAPGVLVRPGQAPEGRDPSRCSPQRWTGSSRPVCCRRTGACTPTRSRGRRCTGWRCCCSTGCCRRRTPRPCWTARSTRSPSACCLRAEVRRTGPSGRPSGPWPSGPSPSGPSPSGPSPSAARHPAIGVRTRACREHQVPGQPAATSARLLPGRDRPAPPPTGRSGSEHARVASTDHPVGEVRHRQAC